MRKKTTREYERQIGGFVPNGIVRGQSRREQPTAEPAPEMPAEPEAVAPERDPTAEKKEKR